MKIDIVLTWVDGNDPVWLKERDKYTENIDDKNIIRYRDMGLLNYWFRGIEKYAPWVNNIYFVTYGHYPSWLNTNHPKLKIVKHEDFIPKEYLPTFSSHTIELNLHRIKGLSEHFIYFNDDIFLIDFVSIEDFFIDNLPVGASIINAISPTNSLLNNVIINDLRVINKYFDKRKTLQNKKNWYTIKYGVDVLRNYLFKYWYGFLGFQNYHGPNAYLKTTFNEVWECEEELLNKTCQNKFRKKSDLNQWVFLYWQFASNKFVSGSNRIIKYYELGKDIHDILSTIVYQKNKIICVNDSEISENYENIQAQLIEAFEKILPNKSKYEI